MRVKMTQQMSGPRGDGQDWPPTGGVLETGDYEAAMIVRNGWGVPVVEERKVETADAPDLKTEVRTAREPDPQHAEPPAAPPEDDESALPVEMRKRGPGRPPGSANKPKP